ncbi:MAG: sigma-70 family RNA polymerase sigma factor [Acidobacteria bacterium]|nr:sigma-70 family RNA polymerase sigma factor [Acidobacteriota bacterium]
MSPDGSVPDPEQSGGESIDHLVATLHDRFWERVRMFAARRLDDASAAADVAQETLRRVIEALRDGRVADLDALPAFLFQTARNICMHHGRARRRRDAAFTKLDREPFADVDTLAALVSEERRRAVRSELAKLDPTDRELLDMIFVRETDPTEVARLLGITPGALRVRKHRALARLGRNFSASGNESGSAGTLEEG